MQLAKSAVCSGEMFAFDPEPTSAARVHSRRMAEVLITLPARARSR